MEVDIATVSSKGQIALPKRLREALNVETGDRVMLMVQGKALLLAKSDEMAWEELTRPLLESPKNIRKDEVATLVKKIRKDIAKDYPRMPSGRSTQIPRKEPRERRSRS
ncbi:MAG: AbrB/MazE/SpoVT family DNA-binding domain-containing protein [Candidatus Woesearchaeota archaeon]